MPGYEPIEFPGEGRDRLTGERLPEQPDPRLTGEVQRQAEEGIPLESLKGGVTVDPAAQALVWGVTASGHAAEALTALARLEDLATQPPRSPALDDHVREQRADFRRLADYHSTAHAIADKCAGTWALVASVQPFYTDESPQDGKSGHDAER